MRTWAYHPDGTVREIVDLPADLVPGINLYTPEHAADMSDITGRTPMPAQGWTTPDGGASFAPPQAPRAVAPAAVSDRQFFQQLAVDGDITETEALAAVQTGKIPKTLSDAIDALPASQRFSARMLVSGAREFQRQHPMVALLGQALGKDDAALDVLWTAASEL